MLLILLLVPLDPIFSLINSCPKHMLFKSMNISIYLIFIFYVLKSISSNIETIIYQTMIIKPHFYVLFFLESSNIDSIRHIIITNCNIKYMLGITIYSLH